MSGSPGVSATAEPVPLPSRALLVAPTVEKAAALAVAFEHAVATTLDDLGAVLAREGNGLRCAAVTGVPARGGRLLSAVAQILSVCPPDVQVILDVADPVGWSVLSDGASALRGLALVDRVDLGDAVCLRFRRAPDPDAVPDLAPVRAELPAPVPSHERVARAVDSVLGATQATELRATVERLRTELAAAQAALATSQARLATARKEQRAAAKKLDAVTGKPLVRAALVAERIAARGPRALADPRARRLAAGAGAAGMLAVGIRISGRGGATGPGGGAGSLLAALLLAGPGPVLYARHANRRLAASIARLARAVDAAAKKPAEDARHAELAAAVAELTERVGEIQRHMAVVAATTVDTAHALARVSTAVPGAGP